MNEQQQQQQIRACRIHYMLLFFQISCVFIQNQYEIEMTYEAMQYYLLSENFMHEYIKQFDKIYYCLPLFVNPKETSHLPFSLYSNKKFYATDFCSFLYMSPDFLCIIALYIKYSVVQNICNIPNPFYFQWKI